MRFLRRWRARSQLQRTIMLIQCDDEVSQCVVHFEPEGAEHLLRSGDLFRVEAVLPADYEIEVSYGPGRIGIWAEQAWGTRAFRRDGTELPL